MNEKISDFPTEVNTNLMPFDSKRQVLHLYQEKVAEKNELKYCKKYQAEQVDQFDMFGFFSLVLLPLNQKLTHKFRF